MSKMKSYKDAPVTIVEDIMDSNDEEVNEINDTAEQLMNFLEIIEMHPQLKREVTRHKFPGNSGIDVIVMPATPSTSPVNGMKPEITKKPQDLDLLVGENATFKVTVADRTGVSVSWSKDRKLLFGSGRIKIWNKENTFFIKISKVQPSDESLYECRVQNEYSNVLLDVQLLVNEDTESEKEECAAKIIKKLKNEYIITEGDSLSLEVHTEGDPVPFASWYYEGQKLKNSADIQILSKKHIHSLYIPESVLDDEGAYKCVVYNDGGEDSVATIVFVDENT